MFPGAVRNMTARIAGHEFSLAELDVIGSMCRSLEGKVDAEKQRIYAERNQDRQK
jgi:hypothetical protein